jgi:hypothetical protein
MCARLIFATLFVLLLRSLATLDTTEFLRHAGDTLTDVTLPNVQQKASATYVPQSRDQHPKTVQALNGRERASVRPKAAASSCTPNDILHTLCDCPQPIALPAPRTTNGR